MHIEIKNYWIFDNPGCDCCPGFWDEMSDLFIDNEHVMSFYSVDAAKVYTFDLLIDGGKINGEHTIIYTLEDCPDGR